MPRGRPKKIVPVADESSSNSIPASHFNSTGAMVNHRDSWRIFRIITEIVEGYQFLGELEKEVVILGSARLPANNKFYQIAVELGRLLGKNGFTTVTGGGPGIMEAANKGAYETGGQSVGLNIQLPFEQRINPYVNKSIAFYYFFTRKLMLTSPGNAFVFFPGGFGTLDEFFEIVDYMEMGFMDKSPVILVGRDFWQPLVDFLRTKSLKQVNSLSEADIASWHIVDSAEEAFHLLKNAPDRPNICNNDPMNPLCQEGTTDWRVFRIMAELVDGFEFLSSLSHNVTVLGTKSLLPGSPYYKAAYDIGALLAKQKHTVITGGGPGIMEAANKGAFDNGGESVGICMKVRNIDRHNNALTKSTNFFFPFVRKLILTAPSEAFVFFPGGFGTMHQLFELLTLIETKKMERLPIILYGRDFWQPLLSYIHLLYADFKTISQDDTTFVQVIDSPGDVLNFLKG
jgi:uncharacterized protein (TIGR00730 family)